KLREALDDDADRPSFIETIPKRGYRFVGTVERISTPAEPATPATAADIGVRRGSGRRSLLAVGAALVAPGAGGGAAASQLRAGRPQVRVAVVLFDNETGKPELAPLAQGLTDATVMRLTGDPRLAVIGNAAILRSTRPFRDIAAVRDALAADFIV